MKKTSLNDLRGHLFETIERLLIANDPDADEKEKIDIETAKAIADVSSVIVQSAKIEADLIRYIANAQNPDLIQRIIKNQSNLLLEEGK